MMELKDYIDKFPAYWRGIFAPLSKNHTPIVGANTWFLENREGALSLKRSSRHNDQIDWMGFVDALCEQEPTESRECLVFLPRILLFPVNIQRNTFAFLSEHLSDIPVRNLDNLLESVRTQQLSDEWVKYHLRKIQDFVCRKQCPNYGSGFCADDHRTKLTKGSWGAFANVCQRIGDKGRRCNKDSACKLQFDWLSDAFATNQRACKHRTFFTSETITPGKRSGSETLQSVKTEEARSPIPECLVKKQKLEDNHSPDVIIIDSLSSSHMEICPITEEKDPSDPETAGGSEVAEDVLRSQKTPEGDVLRCEEDTKEVMAEDRGSKGGRHDNSDDVINAVTMDSLAAMKSVLSNQAAESIQADHLRLLIDCPSHHLEAYCDVLELDSISAAGLNTLTHQLAGYSVEFSHASAVILAKRCFIMQVRNLAKTAPRSLLTAIISLAKTFSKPIIEGALLPALTEEGQGGVATHQCDLVAKVVKEALTNESRVYLLSKILGVKTLDWSEELTGLVQTIVSCKLELDVQTLEFYVLGFEQHGSTQRTCAKFAKLLLAVVNRFSKQISATSLATLQRLVDTNQTFLKKALIAALKRVKV